MFYTIYKITNKIDGKIYIGAHKTSDLSDGYMGSGKYIKRAQKKYGIENFEKEILEVFESSEEMYDMESKLVTNDFIKENTNYNLKEGGEGGFDYLNDNGINTKNHDYKEISKLGVKAFKDLMCSDEYNINHRLKISIGLTKYYKNGGKPTKGFLGFSHTETAREKIGEANRKHQNGEGNSQFGTMWVHSLDLKKSKKIPKDTPIPEGWLKGRKLNFEPKVIKPKICKKCGSDICLKPDICKKSQMFNTLSKFFTFDKDSFGSINVYVEWDRVVKLINDDYHVNKLSTIQIVEKYNFTSTQRLDSVFKSLGIKPRNHSEALKNYVSKK